MINPVQFRDLVIRPALQNVGLWSEAAELLLLGTAAHESRLRYLKQIRGPALGLYQMEPATYNDIWTHFLAHRRRLRRGVLDAIDYCSDEHQYPDATRLITDLTLATLMTRVHYLRVPERLPDADDVPALAAYWKQHYNTHKGAGHPKQFVSAVLDLPAQLRYG